MAVLSSAGIALPARGDSARSLEYRIKAAFIFNFTKFVQWPVDSFEDDNTPITLGIIGNDPFGSILEETFEERTAQGRKIVVERFDGIEQASDCHLLFISDSQAKRLQHVFSKLDDLPILTIGEMEFFAQDGGIIGFYIRKNKVKFEINPEAAKSKRLKISSKLLNLARIVQSNQGR
ncbi:MAG: YfiR family protein [Candidatus Abyssubacteria bacterium]|nr:YfiR family protein [Candidatus Abyssubacteria bacterium]